jgi:hypothetical protein
MAVCCYAVLGTRPWPRGAEAGDVDRRSPLPDGDRFDYGEGHPPEFDDPNVEDWRGFGYSPEQSAGSGQSYGVPGFVDPADLRVPSSSPPPPEVPLSVYWPPPVDPLWTRRVGETVRCWRRSCTWSGCAGGELPHRSHVEVDLPVSEQERSRLNKAASPADRVATSAPRTRSAP